MIDSLIGSAQFLSERGKIACEYTANKFHNNINKAA
jgi:hypothetical protein